MGHHNKQIVDKRYRNDFTNDHHERNNHDRGDKHHRDDFTNNHHERNNHDRGDQHKEIFDKDSHNNNFKKRKNNIFTQLLNNFID